MKTKKKYVVLLSVAMIIAVSMTFFTGCNNQPSANDDDVVLSLITDSFVESYMTSLDIALTGDNELIFTNAEELSSNTLFLFFLHLESVQYYNLHGVDGDGYPGDEYFNVDDNKYHIPVSAIETVVSNSFENAQFKPDEVSYANYNDQDNEFAIDIFAGFGGIRFAKLNSKKIVEKNTVKITVDFYETESCETLSYTKEYVVQHSEQGWKYMSIAKK